MIRIDSPLISYHGILYQHYYDYGVTKMFLRGPEADMFISLAILEGTVNPTCLVFIIQFFIALGARIYSRSTQKSHYLFHRNPLISRWLWQERTDLQSERTASLQRRGWKHSAQA